MHQSLALMPQRKQSYSSNDPKMPRRQILPQFALFVVKIENKHSDRYMYTRFSLLKNKSYLCFSFRKRYLNIH